MSDIFGNMASEQASLCGAEMVSAFGAIANRHFDMVVRHGIYLCPRRSGRSRYTCATAKPSSTPHSA